MAKKTSPSKHVEIPVPSGMPRDLLPIAREVSRIHEAVLWSAQGQFEQTKLWRLLNIVLGVPAAALAALGGGIGLAADERLPYASVLALIAAALTATLTTLNPSRRVSQAQASANAYLGIQTSARQFLTIDLEHMAREEAREELEELTARRDEVNTTSDPPGRVARRRSASVIHGGGQAYDVDTSNSGGGS